MDIHVREMTETTAGIRPPKHRERLKIWLVETMKRKNWSAERWAREADIAGTTITRFLNSDDPHRTPSGRTVEKLARAAGVPAMHEPEQVLIAMIRKEQVLTEARKLHPAPLDLFDMASLDFLPAPPEYADCRAVELDDGRFALCCRADLAELERGKKVLVLRNLSEIARYHYDPPRLVPVENAGAFRGTLPVSGPDHQVLGRSRGIFTPED